MVELVGHAFVNGAVYLDVDIVAYLVCSEISGEGDVTLLPEGTSEEISSARPETVTSRHFVFELV